MGSRCLLHWYILYLVSFPSLMASHCCPLFFIAQLASTVEGFEVAPLQQQREQQSYYVRLGSLSSRLRHRAYQHSLGKVRSAQVSTMETLAQLHQTIDLVGRWEPLQAKSIVLSLL